MHPFADYGLIDSCMKTHNFP